MEADDEEVEALQQAHDRTMHVMAYQREQHAEAITRMRRRLWDASIAHQRSEALVQYREAELRTLESEEEEIVEKTRQNLVRTAQLDDLIAALRQRLATDTLTSSAHLTVARPQSPMWRPSSSTSPPLSVNKGSPQQPSHDCQPPSAATAEPPWRSAGVRAANW